jgi:hypothetical protein
LIYTPTLCGERPKVYNSFALRTTSRQITPAHHNGSWELVYELHIVNCSKIGLTLRRLEVLEAQSGKLRMTLDDVALADVIGWMDRQAIDAVTRIPPGVEVIAYVTAEWSEPAARSITLKHRLTYSTDSDAPSIGTVVQSPPRNGGPSTTGASLTTRNSPPSLET